MPGLIPGISRFGDRETEDVDGLDKPGHDDGASPLVVIASAAKQSMHPLCREMNCFAALA
jgi:hypothetical protein